MLVHKYSPEDAYRPLDGMNPPLLPYRDAGYGPATYHLSVLDILKGMYKAMVVGLLNLDRFDAEIYDFYERVVSIWINQKENGDFNWITDKFLALASPKDDVPTMNAFSRQSSLNRRILGNRTKTTSSGKELYSAYKIDDLIRFLKGTFLHLID